MTGIANYLDFAKLHWKTQIAELKTTFDVWSQYKGEAKMKMTFDLAISRILMKLNYQDVEEIYRIFKMVSQSNMKQRTFERAFRKYRAKHEVDERYFTTASGIKYKKFRKMGENKC